MERQVIHMPGKYLLIIDETAQTEVQNGGWCFEIHQEYPDNRFRIPDADPKFSWWFRQLNMAYLRKQPDEFCFWREMDGSVKAVLYHLPLNGAPMLEGVRLLPNIPDAGNIPQAFSFELHESEYDMSSQGGPETGGKYIHYLKDEQGRSAAQGTWIY